MHAALMFSARSGSVGATRLLLELGAKIDVKNRTGFNPLMCACSSESNQCAIAELLLSTFSKTAQSLQLKGFVNHQDNEGNTALHFATQTGDFQCVRMLVDKYGADIRLRNKKQKTAMEVESTTEGSKECKKYLQQEWKKLEKQSQQVAAEMISLEKKSKRKQRKKKNKKQNKQQAIRQTVQPTPPEQAAPFVQNNHSPDETTRASLEEREEFSILEEKFFQLNPKASNLDLKVGDLVVLRDSMSIAQLDALEEMHIRAIQAIQERKAKLFALQARFAKEEQDALRAERSRLGIFD